MLVRLRQHVEQLLNLLELLWYDLNDLLNLLELLGYDLDDLLNLLELLWYEMKRLLYGRLESLLRSVRAKGAAN